MAKRKLIETRSIDYVPLAERHGKVWHLWPVWFSGDAHLATLAVGVLGITLGGNLLWTSIAVLLGNALGTFFMAFHSTQGPQLGLPQMIQSRPQFGYTGALLVWAVALIAYIGYNAFNQVLAAQALHQLLPAIPATSAAAIVLFALIAVSLAAVGYDQIHRAQRRFAYLMIAILTVFTLGGALTLRFPPAFWDAGGFRAVPFLAQIFAAASYQLSWSIYVSDYSRYLPRDVGVRESFWWTYLGAFIGGAWMMLVGTVAAAMAPQLDVAAAMERAADAVIPGLGKVLIAGALLGLVTITSLNFYGASLTLLSVADTVRPLKCTAGKRLTSLAVALVASTLLALNSSGNFVARFQDYLSLLLYLFTPWTAINLVDFYLVRKGHYSIREIFNSRGMYGHWNWRGLTAYAIGFAVMIPFFSTDLYTGPVARALGKADIAMLVGLPVAAAVYLLTCRSMDLEGDRRRAAAADVGLDPDDRVGAAG
ncbi:MAG TPA: cytosine permease [Steroidobacteraceae bacterium]|jgi:NCS1 family nucleobase:cation symporter-1|nr:cytosine permease [Steroidobacteraceae bacterium]